MLFSSIFIYRMFMKNHKIYHFLTGILRACLKSQFNILLIFILKGFLGVISLTFIPSAIGAKKPNSQEIRVSLSDRMQEPPHTADLADLAVTPSVLPAETSTDSVLNDPKNSNKTIISKSRIKSGFSKKTLNRVQDAIKVLLTTQQENWLKYEIKSLQRELSRKILSDNLTMPEIIDFLTEKIFKKETKKQVAIQLMRELLKKYPLSDMTKVLQLITSFRDIIFTNPYQREASINLIKELLIQHPVAQPEVLKTLNLLQIELSLEQTHYQARQAIIQCMDKILEQYNLPKPEVLKALNQIKENLFHKNVDVRKEAIQVMTKLLKTNKVSDTEKETIISWITDHLNADWWRHRISALETVNEFLNQNTISDPEDKRDIAFKIAERMIEDEDWEARKEAVIISGDLLNRQDIISDPEDRRYIALEIAERMNEDENWGIRREAVIISGALLQQQIVLFDPENKRDIALKIAERMNEDEEWKVQDPAIIISSALLNRQDILPNPEDRKDIALKIVERITEKDNWNTQQTVITNLTILLEQQDTVLYPDDKLKIALMLPKWLTHTHSKIRYAAIQLSEILLSQIELSPDKRRDIVHIIATQIFDPNSNSSRIAARMTKNLWSGDLPLPEKLKIINFLSKKVFETVRGTETALEVLLAAKQADLPLDFDMIYYVASHSSALGKAAENLVREYLNTQSLSDDPETDASLRLTLHLELEDQLAKRSQLAQEQPKPQPDKAGITGCQKSMLPSDNTPPDDS